MSKLSKQRKVTYYLGKCLIIIGLILFITPMLGIFGPLKVFFLSPFLGFGLIALGAIISNIGRLGLAGSGILLDPDRAREDLKPYSKTKGKMMNDAFEEMEILENLSKNNSEPVIKVRCYSCKSLNDETATYCNACGNKL